MAETARAVAAPASFLQFSSTPEIRRVLSNTLKCLRNVENVSAASEAALRNEGEASTSGQTRPTSPDKAAPSTAVESLTCQLKAVESLAAGSDEDVVPYSLLKQCCLVLRGRSHDPVQGPWLHELIQKSQMVLPQPPVRKRSPELEARLAKLQEAAEWKEYNSLVKDVDPSAGREDEVPFMPTFRHQAAFGLNVVTLMVTGYVVGQAAMAALYSKEKYLHPVGGVIGLIISMMVEVVLYVIIADRAEGQRQRKASQPKPRVSQREVGTPPAANPHPEQMGQSSASRSGPRQRKKASRT